MTDDRMALQAHIEKHALASVLPNRRELPLRLGARPRIGKLSKISAEAPSAFRRRADARGLTAFDYPHLLRAICTC